MGLLRWQERQPEWVVFQVKDNQLLGWYEHDQCQLWVADTADVEGLRKVVDGYFNERGLAFETPDRLEPGALMGPWGTVLVQPNGVVLEKARMVVKTGPRAALKYHHSALDPYVKLNYACVDVNKTGGIIVKY
jgi:hypothetical protein